MKQKLSLNSCIIIFFSLAISLSTLQSCKTEPGTQTSTDSVAANIKMYTHVWDEIVNHRRLELFNDSNFTKDVVMHTNPDIVGIDSARAYYTNYLTGFSNLKFTIKDCFGQGNKLAKHWNFSGDNTGVFFGMPATGKHVSIDGVTLVRMQDGKIAEERDFVDNLDMMTQLGQIPAPGK